MIAQYGLIMSIACEPRGRWAVRSRCAVARRHRYDTAENFRPVSITDALRAGRNYAGFARGRLCNRAVHGSAADLHVDLNSPAAVAAARRTDELWRQRRLVATRIECQQSPSASGRRNISLTSIYVQTHTTRCPLLRLLLLSTVLAKSRDNTLQ